jgi:putative transposase
MSAEGAILCKDFLDQFAPCPIIKGMAGKFLCVNLHLIWSTKSRQRLIHPQWAGRLYAYLGSIAGAKNAKLIEANSEPDHVHLYVSIPSTISIADLINACKSNSTRWIRQTFPNRRWFSWQEGYAAFSVSRSQEGAVIEYIRDQHEHHRKRDFQQELLGLLRRHGIKFDLQYVFDGVPRLRRSLFELT